MGFITSMIEKRSVSGLKNPAEWLVSALGMQPTQSGVDVSPNTAMQSTAVFAAVRLLAGTIASLPLPVYQRLDPIGKERAKDHTVYSLLHDRPNEYMSSFVFRQTAMAHQLLWGNAYAEIETSRRGDVKSLWLLPPWRVQPKKTTKGNIYYEVTLEDGQRKNIQHYKMLHFMNLSTNGLQGLSCISAASGKEAIGLSLAAQEFGARFFGGGANVGGFIKHPSKMKEGTYERYKKDFADKYAGLGKSHRVMLLEEGMDYVRAGIPPNEAQFLETRQFQIAEIGRIFGISQLHKLGDLTRATFSNIEQQSIDFVVDSIRPHLINWEQEINYKLFDSSERKKYFSEFLIDGLLRGDSEQRGKFYKEMFNMAAFTPNDILELENRNPYKGGDKHFIQMNMVAVEDLGQPQENQRSKHGKTERRSLATRQNVRESYKRLFEDATKRIVKRERADILRAAKKIFNTRDTQTFRDWLEDFYEKHPDYVRKQFAPVVLALSEAIAKESALEINSETAMTPELEELANKHVDSLTQKFVGRSKGQVMAIVTESWEEGEDIIPALEQRFDEWEEKRAGKVSLEETVQIDGMISSAFYIASGFLLRWVNSGDDTCPYCMELDGRVIGKDEYFIRPGEVLEPDQVEYVMDVRGPKMHPPLHPGCQCQLIPERI